MANFSENLRDFTQSRLAVLIDDVGGGRAVMVAPAQDISAHEVNSIITFSGGLTFVAVSAERATSLMLSPMSRDSRHAGIQAQNSVTIQYTSVEAREGVSTGISAADRATTIRILGAANPNPRALVKPGHIFPVYTSQGASLAKASIPEAALDIVKLARFTDAALFVDLLDISGELLSSQAAEAWAAARTIPIFSISGVIQYRLTHEPLITRLSEANIPTELAGEVRAIAYKSKIHDVEHIALIKGELNTSEPVLTRVQVENTVADVFGGGLPPSRKHLHDSLRALSDHGSGVILYLRRSRLSETAVFLPQSTSETSALNTTIGMREYGIGAQILRELGITRIDLLSSTNRTLMGLDSFGISIHSQRPIPCYHKPPTEQN